MVAGSSWPLLSLAFSLGLVHALDADHVMTISVLAQRQRGLRKALRFSLGWSLGHNLSLVLIGGAVLLLGLAIPVSLSHWAELTVGLLLIMLGCRALWDLVRNVARLRLHRHDNLPLHGHGYGYRHPEQAAPPHRHGRTAVLIGMLHGAAGSAPLLVLLPVAALASPWLGLAYLLLFGLGVVVAMLACGGMLGLLVGETARRGGTAWHALRGLVGLGTMGSGVYLLAAAA